MDLYDAFQELSGERWIGVGIREEPGPKGEEGLRICEAIHEAFEGEVWLRAEDVVCPGGRRCLRAAHEPGEMALHIHQAAALPLTTARGIVEATPRFPTPVGALRLGRIASPTVLVAYPTPERAMQLLRRWQCERGETLPLALSAFGAVCSTVAAASLERTLLFSLGCPESRRHGALPPDRVAAAISVVTVEELLRSAGLSWIEPERPRQRRATASRRPPSAIA